MAGAVRYFLDWLGMAVLGPAGVVVIGSGRRGWSCQGKAAFGQVRQGRHGIDGLSRLGRVSLGRCVTAWNGPARRCLVRRGSVWQAGLSWVKHGVARSFWVGLGSAGGVCQGKAR